MPTFVCPWKPNARPEPRLEAGARHEQTLEAVSSRPLFGAGSGRDIAFPSSRIALTLTCGLLSAHPAPVWHTDTDPGLHSSWRPLCHREGAQVTSGRSTR